MGRDVRELRGAWTSYQRHAFHDPSPTLAPWVERYWEARWDYAEPYRQKIVPYPNVHLSFGGGRADVNGVCSGYQLTVLEGRDHVFGVASGRAASARSSVPPSRRSPTASSRRPRCSARTCPRRSTCRPWMPSC